METAKPKEKLRWHRLTPDRLPVVLLALEGFLFLSERFQWFGFDERKGWPAILAVAAVGSFLILMLLWFIVGILFRCRFQFGIRSLLLLTVAVAIPCSWLAAELKSAREQRAAIEAILKLNGRVLFGSLEIGKDMELIVRNPSPRGPTWLMNLLGGDFFEDVASVDFTNERIADAGLKNIEGFTQLRNLSLYNTDATDDALVHLKGLTQLQKLELVGTQVTDAGLMHLKGLTKLQYLLLIDTRVTDAGLEHLQGLAQLNTLMLSGTQVTDIGLEHLKGLSKLQWLLLSDTQITDAGLEPLKGLANLQYVQLRNTRVTAKGIEKLQQALPKCKIEH